MSAPDMAQGGPCGRGELSLQLGRGRPMHALSDPAPAMIEYGLQGGYHVDLSFAFQGSIDPDLISLRLSVSDREGWQIGEHFTAGWYLLLEESEAERPTCYFYDARLFLYERDGSLPSEETVSRLAGREESLEIELEEQSGAVHSFVRSLLFTLPEE
ncbi:MAG: hypothetical protein VYD19_08990 [Myxococcota bacterium]|nr:hypothetical protein [Myxococcota bacterium]